MIMGSGCGPAEQTRRRTGREIAVVPVFLDSVPRGPRALLVEGGAGIGKSTGLV